MTPERWRRAEELFHLALARDGAARAAFLAEACADDEAMRRNVESLLAEAESDDDFLAAPAVDLAAHIMQDAIHGGLSGRTLGAYHVRDLIGAGGMGDVYRAHDGKLGRDVAIKVLPSAFTSHPDRLARLEREARMLAALNHPNICAIYGFENAEGVSLLVLELVEGETLAEALAGLSGGRVERAGLPLNRALDIARQIAQALEVAHEKGIVHRDLKPANVKITPRGAVKVLDFGLAKAVAADAPAADLSHVPLDEQGRSQGAIIGTAAYMSPEQARGLLLDKRTDIWAFGCVLYEMLTGQVTFAGDTVSDSIARVLEREPDWTALPVNTPASVRRLLLRCLAKDRDKRLRDMGDVRIEIDAVDEALPGITAAALPSSPKRRGTWLPWVGLAALALGVVTWEARRPTTNVEKVEENALANATFSRVTNWEGTEEHAEISPDGRYVAFLADRLGELDMWVSQLGTGTFDNLTSDIPGMRTPGNLLRTHGFSGDGSEIWFNPRGNPGQEKVLIPLRGGTARPFLDGGHSTPSWSPDNAQLAYIKSSQPGDPLFVADRTGAQAGAISVPDQGNEPFFRRGVHTHNPVWSPDGRWLYVVHGSDPNGKMDIWRMRSTGELPEQLTHQNVPANFLAALGDQTLLYVAREDDWSGPWLWALDVETKVTRRATTGLEQYTSVSASRDGRRVVATVANPTASLWRVPLLDRAIEDRDVQPYDVPGERASAPRFAGTSLFYLSLSSRGTGDGLWRVQNGQPFELRRGADGALTEPAAVSPDGSRVAVVVRQQGRRSLAIMSADGTNARRLAPSIEIQGAVGQGTAEWSPDGKWIVTGGRDEQGLMGLFKIPVDGGDPVRLVAEEARNPVWSPKGDLIVYAIPFAREGGLDGLRGVRPDGSPVTLPEVRVRLGGAHRFLPSGAGVVYLPSIETKDFWLLDLTTNTVRQLTHLSDRGFLNTFDITPDGKHLVFDRTQQNSDVVLIELQKQ